MRNELLLPVFMLISLGGLAQEPPQDAPPPQSAQMQQMQNRMQSMREQMARIHATQDPEERRRLMQAHRESMHEGMMMMGRMMGGPMARQQGEQCPQGDTECRLDRMQTQQRMMGQGMGMMQQMMQQMMEHMMAAPDSDRAEPPAGNSERP